MALPERTIKTIVPESRTIICWLVQNNSIKLLESFLYAMVDVIKTCKTTSMDTLFKPIIDSGMHIPEDILSAITTFTQVVTEYTPKQRNINE